MAINKPIDFYQINIDYVRELYKHDSQVYFVDNCAYANKPYIGIIVEADMFDYFVPLTSRKPKHVNYKNTGPDYALIYEYVYREELVENDVFVIKDKSPVNNDKKDIMKKILSMLDYKKAIPVPKDEYQKISIIDNANRDLLSKEYGFLLPKSDKIREKMLKIISRQKLTATVQKNYCNFFLLESICKKWAYDKMHIECINPKIVIKCNEQLDLSKLIEIKNGTLKKQIICMDEPGIYKHTITVCDEYEGEKSIEIEIEVIETF